jgi:hypothetical protein
VKELAMPYTAARPKLAPDTAELRNRIPGWGVDLDPKDRPAVPKENFNPAATGAHWDYPERQVAHVPREKSPEHQFLTPVFGTACPPKGLSGALRRYAYRYSEGRARHWLLLMLADRVDVLESAIGDALRGRPDNFIAEYGVRSEFTRGGLRSRLGRGRADVRRIPLELMVFAGLGLAVAGLVVRRARR